ncbi:hypothetical protein ACQQ9V_00850 [Hornefia butyriciproducens]|uniref:hypothetical protein n=1 Tax=Hornefia butyriciproducens TaxID=2652293 RepID=UPI003D0711E8
MIKKMIPEIIKPASILLSQHETESTELISELSSSVGSFEIQPPQHDAAVSFCGKVSRLISAGKGNYTTNNRKETQVA